MQILQFWFLEIVLIPFCYICLFIFIFWYLVERGDIEGSPDFGDKERNFSLTPI